MFHVNSLLNLRRDSRRPPTVRCQVMNIRRPASVLPKIRRESFSPDSLTYGR